MPAPMADPALSRLCRVPPCLTAQDFVDSNRSYTMLLGYGAAERCTGAVFVRKSLPSLPDIQGDISRQYGAADRLATRNVSDGRLHSSVLSRQMRPCFA